MFYHLKNCCEFSFYEIQNILIIQLKTFAHPILFNKTISNVKLCYFHTKFYKIQTHPTLF